MEKTPQLDLLIDIAQEILAANPRALLSGSLSLRLQGVKIMREPKDIDIYIPAHTEFVPIIGLEMSNNADITDYPDDGWDRQEYRYKGCKIDVFTEEHIDDETKETELEIYRLKAPSLYNNIPLVNKLDIIKLKASHAFGDHWTRYKHRNDIVYMMIGN